jgi:hypothetical protein
MALAQAGSARRLLAKRAQVVIDASQASGRSWRRAPRKRRRRRPLQRPLGASNGWEPACVRTIGLSAVLWRQEAVRSQAVV